MRIVVRSLLVLWVACAVFLQCGCEFTDDAARSQITAALSPYFPDVRPILDHRKGLLLGTTCIFGNVGSDMLQMVDNQIQQKAGQLALLPLGGFKVLAIGFEHVVIEYDPVTRRLAHLAATPEYVRAYSSTCGRSSAALKDAIFIGKFAYTLNGEGVEHTTYDTLGLYKVNDFPLYRDIEVNDRIEMIRRNMAARGTPVAEIHVVEVVPVPIPGAQPN